MRSNSKCIVLILWVTFIVICGSWNAAFAWIFTSPVAYSGVTSTSAAITWSTDVPAPTQVKYGVKVNGVPILEMLNQQASVPGLTTDHNITITNLLPSTIYYAAAVKEDGNVSFPVQFTTFNSTALLTVDFTGTGSGAVYSSPDNGIICIRGDGASDCSESYYTGITVTLIPVVSNSTFTGWSGGCIDSSGNCTVEMIAAKSVTATFNVSPATVKLDDSSTAYYTIDSTLDLITTDTGVVYTRDIIFTENIIMASPAGILIKGGYIDNDFINRNPDSFTTIDGSLTVQNGTLCLEQVIIM